MKNPKRILFQLLLTVLIIPVLQGCSDKPGNWHNEQIAAGKRKDFHSMNDQVLKALKTGSLDTLNAFLSKDMIDDIAGTQRQVDLIDNQLKTGDYTLFDEYYIIRDTANGGGSSKILSPGTGKNAYGLNGGFPGKTYIALFLPKDKNNPNQDMIGITYFEFEYGWKISNLDLGPYTVNGKTSPELFDEAKQEYAKKYYINALNIMQSASYCLRPVAMWDYPHEDEMGTLNTTLFDYANSTYKFPLVLTQVPSHPKIFRIMNKYRKDGAFPMVYYQSSVKLSDAVAVKMENEQIQKVIGSVIPGIDKDGKYLLYAVYNVMPNINYSPDSFEITQKIGQ